MRIAVDAMGGDHAPNVILEGAAFAVSQGRVKSEQLILVGMKDRLEEAIAQMDESLRSQLAASEIVHASQVVDMGEKASEAFRKKKDSSIVKATGLVKAGEASAVVSAGDTGIAVACGILQLRQLPGVRRPGIAVTMQSVKGPCTVMDVGANIQAKSDHLFQYGIMASTFSRDVLGVENPRIGLLSIGEEESKGNELIHQTRALFEESDVNFVGHIEGQDVFSGRCDVVVCDGFVGNVVLKVAEGMGGLIHHELKKLAPALQAAGGGSGSAALKEQFGGILKRLDYAEYGGAPLLGVEGLVVICHGRSDKRAIANAIGMANNFIVADVNEHIRSTLAAQAGGGSVAGQVPG